MKTLIKEISYPALKRGGGISSGQNEDKNKRSLCKGEVKV